MTYASGVISGIRVSHENASVDEIDAASDGQKETVESLLAADGVEEAFALQTCNRSEAYVVTDRDEDGRTALDAFAADLRGGAVVRMDHEESLRHLMRVAAGLESLVLGEDQIIGQLRTAYEEARGVGGIGPMLESGITKAIHVGERARNETAINEGAVSLGSAAAELADDTIDLSTATALVVGAGEMGTLSARALADTGVDRLLVANRTVPHAEHVAAEVDAEATAVGLAALETVVARADLVISATGSPEYVLDAETVSNVGETHLIDIAQPRDVDPDVAGREDVTLHDLDALKGVTGETRERRRAAADRVEAMIDEEFERLVDQYKRKRADDVISTMHESAERVKAGEVETALTKLDARGEFTDDQREIVEAMADALVSKLLAAPTKSLRDAAAEDDWTTINTALQLFDPEFDGEDPPFPSAEELLDSPPEGMPANVAADVLDDD